MPMVLWPRKPWCLGRKVVTLLLLLVGAATAMLATIACNFYTTVPRYKRRLLNIKKRTKKGPNFG